MLPSNGRKPKQRYNYHMKTEEFKILLRHVEQRYDPKFCLMLLIQYGMGLRASEMLNIQIWDFSHDFRQLTFRQAKKNDIVTDPVPEPLRQKIICYIMKNRHRLADGYLFGTYTGKGMTMTTTCYGTLWTKWRRQLAKKHPAFLDKYEFGEGRRLTRYRISSHSLRRLHRTTLVNRFPDKLFEIMTACHYSDFGSFKRYINDFEMLQRKEVQFRPVLDEALQKMSLYAEGQQMLTSI